MFFFKKKEIVYISESEKSTLNLGELLGSFLFPGHIVFLDGDLGSGKTVLTKGIAEGLEIGSECRVCSPSFTLMNIYFGRVKIYHVDYYRLDINDNLVFEMFNESSDGVLIIEWSDRLIVKDLFQFLMVKISLSDLNGYRRISLSGSDDLLKSISKKIIKF